MKKLLVMLVVMMFSTSVFATDAINSRRDSLKSSILERFTEGGTATDQLNASRVETAINEAITAVCTDFPAYQAATEIIIDTATQGTVLPDDFYRLRMVFRTVGDTFNYPLQIVPPDSISWKVLSTDQHRHQRGLITSPAYVYAFAGSLYTHPRFIADNTYGDTLLVFYYAMGEQVTIGASQVDVLPEYRGALITYAVSILYEEIGLFQEAAYFRARYDYMVTGRQKDVPIVNK